MFHHASSCAQECAVKMNDEKQRLKNELESNKEWKAHCAMSEHILKQEVEYLQEQLSSKHKKLEACRGNEEQIKDNCVSSIICVANLPAHSGTVTLRNLLEQHGVVKYIFPIHHLKMAIVKFAEEKAARSALLYSKETGFSLDSSKLCVSTVNM